MSLDDHGQPPASASLLSTVSPAGEIDAANAFVLLERVVSLSAQSGADVVVDFTDVTFVDTAGVKALVDARTQLRSDGHGMSVRSPTRPLVRMLELFGYSDMIEDGDGGRHLAR